MRSLVSLLLLALTLGDASAQELRVGLGAMTRSMDPHFANTGPDVANSLHLFDKLIQQDENQTLKPGLAVAWHARGARSWEIELRRGVRFHDGSPFTADDVAFTVKRAVDVPNSSSPFTTYLRAIERVEIIDPHRILVHTREPSPLLPWDLSTFGIISRRHGEGAATADYNSGRAAIGTGPYRLVEFVPNERITIERNAQHWGEKEPWARVSFRLIANPAVRTAALLAGDVDAIDTVAAQDLARLKATTGIGVWRAASNRVIYLLMDSHREATPNIRDLDGKPLGVNPLRDPRVRLALSKSLARDALVERILEGEGIAAGQLVPPGFFGHDPSLVAPAQDLAGARQLLAEAGFANGFQLTLHGSNGRYLNDVKLTQAIGQMITRLGLQVAVETLPRQIYGTRGNNFDYSVALYGWGSDTGEAGSSLKALIHSRDDGLGMGASNRGRYANPAIDKVIVAALASFDDAQRERLLQEATRLAMEDAAIIPLYFQVNTWATRDGISFTPRADEFTLAMSARPKR